MAMPKQLARAQRPKRSTPRPLAEQLTERIDIADLCRLRVFPTNRYDQYHLELPFKYPFAKNLLISLQNIEINHHLGYTQRISLRWVRTGFGGNNRPRPLFMCTNCGRSVRRVYFKSGHLACRRCQDAIYASQLCGKRSRPILQAKRLHSFLEFKSGTGMSKRNQQRVQARLTRTTKPPELTSKRIDDRSKLPQSNYSTRGAMHWR